MRRPDTLWLAFSACGLVACAAGPVASPGVDERLATLPADATVVVSLDAPALVADVQVAALMSSLGVPAGSLDGVPDGVDVERVRLGCGSEGCVALLEGNFAGVGAALDAAVSRAPAEMDVARVVGERAGLDAVGPGGEDVVFRVLSPEKAVFGDRVAVQAAWERGGTGGLDPAAIAARVPSSENWVLILDPAAFESFALARAKAVSDASASELAARFQSGRQRFPELAAAESVGFGLAGSTARVRVTAPDEFGAIAVEARARATTLWRAVRIQRVGRVVDAEGSLGDIP